MFNATETAVASPSKTRDSRSSVRADLALFVAIAVVAALLALIRVPINIRDVIWGEDGRNFLDDRLLLGPWQSVFQVYEGYVHVVPRLLTNLAVLVAPIDDFAIMTAVLSSAVFGVVAALVFVCSRDVIRNTFFRLLLASVTVLAPALSTEVLGNFANVHWVLLWLAPWLLLYRPRTTIGAVGLGIIGLLCGLTEIQMILFVPLVLVNLRAPRAWIISIPTIAGVLAQLAVTVLFPRTPNIKVKPGPLDILVGYGEVPVLGAFEGNSTRIGKTLADGGWGVAAANIIVVVLVIAFCLVPVRHGRGLSRLVPLVLVGASFVLWAAAIWLNPNPLWQYADLDHTALEALTATRYVAVPSMLLLGAIIFSAAQAYQRTGKAGFLAGIAVGIVAMGFVGSFQVDRFSREGGPQWHRSIADARASCLDGVDPIEIRTTPSHWFVTVPCDALRTR